MSRGPIIKVCVLYLVSVLLAAVVYYIMFFTSVPLREC